MVVFGAGASFDSVPSFPPNPQNLTGLSVFRPPLANELFDGRPRFVEVRTRFPDCHPIIPYLQNRDPDQSVESILQTLQAETSEYPERKKQLASIRYYLQMMLWGCQYSWELDVSKGVTDQITLLDQIRHWNKSKEPVCLVTFNYDTLLERALSTIGIKIENLSDYISNDHFKLIKLHGSVNWGRTITTNLRSDPTTNAWETVHEIINRISELSISNIYHIVSDQPAVFVNNIGVFPALAIPVESKLDFECPSDHIEVLKQMIPEVDKLLVIGWRASEEPFLELLAGGLTKPIRAMVVAGGKAEAQIAIGKLQIKGIKGNYMPSKSGFSQFIISREGEQFLRG